MDRTRIESVCIAVAAFLVGGAMAVSESLTAPGAPGQPAPAPDPARVKPVPTNDCGKGPSPCVPGR